MLEFVLPFKEHKFKHQFHIRTDNRESSRESAKLMSALNPTEALQGKILALERINDSIFTELTEEDLLADDDVEWSLMCKSTMPTNPSKYPALFNFLSPTKRKVVGLANSASASFANKVCLFHWCDYNFIPSYWQDCLCFRTQCTWIPQNQTKFMSQAWKHTFQRFRTIWDCSSFAMAQSATIYSRSPVRAQNCIASKHRSSVKVSSRPWRNWRQRICLKFVIFLWITLETSRPFLWKSFIQFRKVSIKPFSFIEYFLNLSILKLYQL